MRRAKDGYDIPNNKRRGGGDAKGSRVGEFSISILEPCISDLDVVSRVINYDARVGRSKKLFNCLCGIAGEKYKRGGGRRGEI